MINEQIIDVFINKFIHLTNEKLRLGFGEKQVCLW